MRYRGRDTLAEVIPIRPLPVPRPRGERLRSLITMAREFASLRPGGVGGFSPPSTVVACPSLHVPGPTTPHDAA